LFGGMMPPFFTPASYPALIMAAACRHPIFLETCWVPKWIFYEKFPARKPAVGMKTGIS
jgi:hypothetical protein